MKRHFTMIELLVVIAILAVASVLVGLGVRSALFDQRYKTEINVVVDQLRTAQDLMLFASAEAYVKFTKDDQGRLISWIEVTSKLPPFLEKQVALSRRTYQALTSFEFFEPGRSSPIVDKFQLEFGSHGTSMTRGVLRLRAGSDNAWIRDIDLVGSPEPIAARKNEQGIIEDTVKGYQQYERMTQNIMLQIPENDPLRNKPKVEVHEEK